MEYGITFPDYYTRPSRGMVLFIVIGYKKTIEVGKCSIHKRRRIMGYGYDNNIDALH
jgi:hypothetical protein